MNTETLLNQQPCVAHPPCTDDPCPICRNRKCDCDAKFAPYELRDKYNIGWGRPVSAKLALRFKRMLDNSSAGPAKVLTRDGQKVNFT